MHSGPKYLAYSIIDELRDFIHHEIKAIPEALPKQAR